VNPNRFNSVYGAGFAAETAKQSDAAMKYYQQLIDTCARGDSTRPELVHAREFVSGNKKTLSVR
jgi:hypothetical protein